MSASIYYVDERDDYIRAMGELQFPPAQKKKMVDEINQPDSFFGGPQNGAVPGRARKQQNHDGYLRQSQI